MLTILPESLEKKDLDKYYVGDSKDYKTLQDVFLQLINSAQSYQRMPNVIKLDERRDIIKSILFDYDLEKIAAKKPEYFYQLFRREFNVTSKDSPQNSWRKWSKSVVDAAKFVNEFTDVDDFNHFVKLFDYNLPTRMALPLLISTKISGIGFALACDSLKELGFTNYPKPDTHLIDVFSAFELSDRTPISVFEAIVKMAEDCKSIDESVTPYKVDKIMWLICTGRFYMDDINVGRHKDEFIERMIGC